MTEYTTLNEYLNTIATANDVKEYRMIKFDELFNACIDDAIKILKNNIEQNYVVFCIKASFDTDTLLILNVKLKQKLLIQKGYDFCYIQNGNYIKFYLCLKNDDKKNINGIGFYIYFTIFIILYILFIINI